MKKPRFIGIEHEGVKFLVDMQELMVDILDTTAGDTKWSAFEDYATGETVFDEHDRLIRPKEVRHGCC